MVVGLAPLGCPYVGLSFYTEHDASLFFGRETERRVIIANLRASRLTVLYAQSGVGKSSLLRAGVVSRLRELAQQSRSERGSARHFPVVLSSWRDDPVEDVIDAIQAATTEFAPSGADTTLPRDDLVQAIDAAATATGATPLIILDQFEDYLLYQSRETQPGRMAANLAECINRADLRGNFLIAVREDAYAGIGDLFEGRIANIYGNFLHLDYLDRAAAREAIEKPLQRFKESHPDGGPAEIEPALVDAVLDQVRAGQVLLEQSGRGALAEDSDGGPGDDEIETPYLQLVMTTLWERERAAGSSRLRLATLADLGGAQEIVRTHLDTALADLTDDERLIAADVFHHLVTPSGTKIAHSVADLVEYTGHDARDLEPLIEKLAAGDRRILRLVPGGATGEPRVEIFHDVLAAAILAWRTRQTAARLQRERDAAERGERLARRRARVFLALALGAMALLVVAAVAVVFAEVQRSHANHAQHESTSASLAGDGFRELANRSLVPAVLLGIAAYRDSPSSAARDDLDLSLVSTQRMAGYLSTQAGPVTSVAFDPTNAMVASASSDGTIVLLNVHTRRSHTLAAGPGSVDSLAFNRAGTLLASGGSDGSVVLWDPVSGHRLRVLHRSDAPVRGLAFDPDAHLLAFGGEHGSVLLRDLRTGRTRTLVSHAGSVRDLAFDPKGRALASAQSNGSVVIWNVSTGRARRRLVVGSHHKPVNAVAFSPAGTALVAGAQDGSVDLFSNRVRRPRTLQSPTGRHALLSGPVDTVAFSSNGTVAWAGNTGGRVAVFSPQGGRLVQTLQGQGGAVRSVAFSPSGRLLVSGSEDHSVALFHTAFTQGEQQLVTHQQAALGVAISPDGHLVATANYRGTVSLWNRITARQRLLPNHPVYPNAVAFDSGGQELAAAGYYGRVILWSLRRLNRPKEFPAPKGSGQLLSVAFKPDGRTVAAGTQSGDVLLWDVATGRLIRDLHGNDGEINGVAFSPDGKRIAAGDADDTTIVWDLATGSRVLLGGHTQPVTAVAFSPHGNLVASGSDDETIILSNAETGRQVGAPLRGHQDRIESVAFSPDGQTMTSGGADHAVIVWNLANGLGQLLGGHADAVYGVAYDRSGREIATADATGTVNVYRAPSPTDPATIERQLCAIIGRNLSRAEWRQAAPTEPYQRPCPGAP